MDNYVKYKPDEETLNWNTNKCLTTKAGKKFQPYSIKYIKQMMVESVKANQEVAQRIKTLKRRISTYDYRISDEKQLISDYIEYMAIRAKGDKLYIGRVRGNLTPYKDIKIISILHGKKCVLCGAKKHLEIHHINNLSADSIGNRDIANQTIVCSKCHRWIHE